MKYMVDIDGTICTNTGGDYKSAEPLPERIAKLNELFDEGHEIHYWTARGGNSGIDWSILMLTQLRDWGVKYTSANIGKPVYDIWIDDKAVSDVEFFK
jgi:hypothetical protein